MKMVYDPRNPLGIQDVRDLLYDYFELEVDFMVDPSYHRKEQFFVIRSMAIADIDKYTSDEVNAFVPYIAIDFLDRFLSRNANIPVILPGQGVKRNIELFAFCCVTLASKTCFSEFSFNDLLNKHQVAEVKDVEVMELQILEGLNHKIRPVTPMTFLYFLMPHEQKMQQVFLSTFESCLLFDVQRDIRFTRYRSSTIAASAILATTFNRLPGAHSEFLKQISGTSFFQRAEVEVCFDELRNYVIIPGHMINPVKHPSMFTQAYRSCGIRPNEENLRKIEKDFLAEMVKEIEEHDLIDMEPGMPRPALRPLRRKATS